MHPIIDQINKSNMKKTKLPDFSPGDTVRVSLKVKEGDKERIQNYEGVVIARRGGGLNQSFTVRRVSFGVGIERIFNVNSPVIQTLKVVRKGKVRRAKLFYLRDLSGKKARVQEIIQDVNATGKTEPTATAAPDKAAATEPAATV
jgi:large subunit ribosomal protein L19